MNLSDFDFALPEELIAQNPLERRDSSRLMSVDREAGGIKDCRFTDICDLLTPQDVLVINNRHHLIESAIKRYMQKRGAPLPRRRLGFTSLPRCWKTSDKRVFPLQK